MSWICSKCGLTNVNFNYYCADEKCRTRVYGPLPADSFWKLIERVYSWESEKILKLDLFEQGLHERRENPVTPQEQQYADFFAKAVVYIKDMTQLELRAFREDMRKKIMEAKAFAHAAELRDRELDKENGKGPKGFHVSINEDSSATDAINSVKERQKRIKSDNQKKLSKTERMQKNMIEKLGMDPEYVKKITSPSHILASIRTKGETKDKIEKKEKDDEAKPIEPSLPKYTPPDPNRKLVNPFKKKKIEESNKDNPDNKENK